jgi:O-succinylbenzoic acid--CoA ligase
VLEKSGFFSQAVVFGVPDERWGQIVAVGLVMHPDVIRSWQLQDRRPESPPEEWGFSHLQQVEMVLARFKRPRLAAIVPSLPMTPSGKLDRAAARRDLTPLLQPVPRPRA